MVGGFGIRGLVVGAALMMAVGGAWGAEEGDAGKLPAVLGEVPADVSAVLVVPNVHDLSTKSSMVGARLGLPVPPDVVGFLLRNLGVTKGFEESGSAAAMFLKAPATGAAAAVEAKQEEALGEEPPSLVLVPTNDAEGLLSTFSPGEKDAAGIMEITLAQDTAEKAYAAVVDGGDAGKWIAVSEQKETLAAYLKRSGETLEGTLTPEAKRALAGCDVGGWVNAAQVGPDLVKALDEREQDVTGRLDLINVTSGEDAVTSAVEKQTVEMVFDGLKAGARDAQVGVVAAHLSEAGVSVQMVGTFGAKTETGKLVAAQKGATAPGLKGLPGEGGFLLAGSDAWEPGSTAGLFAQAVSEMLGKASEGQAGTLRSIADLQRQVLSQSSGVRFVLLDGTGAAPTTRPAQGVGLLNGALLLDTNNAERVAGLELQSFQMMRGGIALSAALELRATVTADAVTVKDVKLSKVQLTCALRAGAEAQGGGAEEGKAELAVMNRVLGPQGLTLYVASVEKQVVIIFGNDAGTLEAGLAAAEGGSAGLSQNSGVAQAAAAGGAVDHVVGEGYVQAVRLLAVVDQVLTPGNGPGPGGGGRGGRGGGRGRGRGGRGGGAGGFGQAAAGPAIRVSVGTSGSTAEVDLFVPMATLQGVWRLAGLGG